MVRNKFDEQLQRLHAEMMAMGGMIERAIRAAGDLLQTRDLDRARDLIGRDDEVDRKEREIEALCLRLILMQQPVARALDGLGVGGEQPLPSCGHRRQDVLGPLRCLELRSCHGGARLPVTPPLPEPHCDVSGAGASSGPSRRAACGSP